MNILSLPARIAGGPLLQCCDAVQGRNTEQSETGWTATHKHTHLAGVVEELVLKLLDAQDLLEHLVELVLAQDEL